MKVIRVKEKLQLSIDIDDKPQIEHGDDVLIRVKAAGICGSDLSIYQGTSPVATYPRVIGHEFAGEVEAVGSDVSDFKPGDHVVVNPVCNCGTCRVCQKGRGNVCPTLKVMGVHIDGGYREYVCVPAKNVFTVNKQIPWDLAAIVEPYSVAAQVVERSGAVAGDTVLICGSGQIALTILQVCNIVGIRCIMTDIIESRRRMAKQFGAAEVIDGSKEDVVARVKELTDGIGADAAIDAACVGKTLEEAALSVRPAGVVVTMGFKERITPITEFLITSRELDIRGSRLNNNQFGKVIRWLEEGKLDPGGIITDRIPFTDVAKGFEKFTTDAENTMKVILTFDQ